MEDDFCYLDIIALKKIDAKTTIENFGTIINMSFFEGANLLGSLKLRKLLDAESKFPGPSVVKLSKEGQKLLKTMEKVSKDSLKEVDFAILKSIRKGNRTDDEIEANLILAKKDIAVHLNKLQDQSFVDFTIKDAKVQLALTDQGFEMVNTTQTEVESEVKEEEKEEVEAEEKEDKKDNEEDKKEKLEILTRLKEELKYVLYSHSTGILIFLLLITFAVFVLFVGV